jgi:zinc and cadmium transporter
MTTPTAIFIYALGIAAISLVGGWLPQALRLSHRPQELVVSFIGGAMLGVGLLHLLPHAAMARMDAAAAPSADGHALFGPLMLWMLAGFLCMFLVERFFCFHHHDAPDDGAAPACPHAGERDHPHHHADHGRHRHALTWTGAAIGLTLHSLLEGVALAASASVEPDGLAALLAALGTFIVIALHKPFDSMTLGTLMVVAGLTPTTRRIVNIAFALVVPIGAAAFMLGLMGGESGARQDVLAAALAFSAGTFLCISLSDLLPELQFHQHDRVKLTAALLLGLGLAWVGAALEARTHDHTHDHAAHEHDHHADHDH